jgi:hypothetical protein
LVVGKDMNTSSEKGLQESQKLSLYFDLLAVNVIFIQERLKIGFNCGFSRFNLNFKYFNNKTF